MRGGWKQCSEHVGVNLGETEGGIRGTEGWSEGKSGELEERAAKKITRFRRKKKDKRSYPKKMMDQ